MVELDGCHIRTGIFQSAKTQQLTKKRQLPKKKRTIEWREVRVGLARPLENKEKRTFVALMSKYPEVVNLLVSAAIDQGMSRRSNIYAVADGGNGLYSELQSRAKALRRKGIQWGNIQLNRLFYNPSRTLRLCVLAPTE